MSYYINIRFEVVNNMARSSHSSMKIVIVFAFILCSCSAKSVSNNDLNNNQKNVRSLDTFQYLTLQALGQITGRIGALSKTIGSQQQRPAGDLNKLYAKLNQTQQELQQLVQQTNNFQQQQTSIQQQQKSNFAEINKKLNERRYNPGRYVFRAKAKGSYYKFTFVQAKAACESMGAKLATLHNLKVAYKFGMDVCACGWIAEGYATYPAQWSVLGCRITLDQHCYRSNGKTWDAFCFRYGYAGDITIDV